MLEEMKVFDAEKGGAGSSEVIAEPQAPTATQPEQGEKRFTQAEVDQVVKERIERERKKAQELASEARKQADADAAVKNGEWQKLAEQREAELKRYQADMRERDIKLTAMKMGIKDLDYAVYLVTKAGAEADVEAILKEHNTTTAPAATQQATGTMNPTNPAASQSVFSRSQLADPTFFQANRAAILQAAREGRIRED